MQGDAAQLGRAFGALAPLQPVRWTARGLICAPRVGAERAAAALALCPFPVTPIAELPGLPEPPADHLVGWYRRGPDHATGPEPERELIQIPGEGFGPGNHPTTAMCLQALTALPPCDALDAGCGSGLLAQAWARLTGRSVLACDADPAAVRQARASATAAGLAHRIDVVAGLVENLPDDQVAGRVLLANLPAAGHRSLQRRLPQAPPGVVASGIHRADAPAIVAGYRAHGLRVVRAAQRGRWQCWTLVRR